jgi:glycine/D-amino acid oxidase-like deaminating enzyme
VAYQQCGTIWLASDDDEMHEAKRKAHYYRDRDWAAECIDAQQLHELEPHVAPDLCGGLLVPNDAIVYPPLAAKFLFEQARLSGVQRIQDRVIEIRDHEVVTASQQRIRADVIIVCAGNESSALLPMIPLRAKKGQLAITERGPTLVHHQLIELGYIKNAHASDGDSVAANIQPRPTQQLLIGSSRQFDQRDKSIHWPLLREMLKRAQRFVPALAQQNIVRVWTGVRPTTPDNLPLIGEYDHKRGIWLNCGHEGLGVATALASAELITAQLGDGHSPLNHARFNPQRFDGGNQQ